ncbi:MAG: hypothetical protein JWO48_1500 [Bryobacterales bacterium]|nr:hypothetical protein [Bryobacterales bacterium]
MLAEVSAAEAPVAEELVVGEAGLAGVRAAALVEEPAGDVAVPVGVQVEEPVAGVVARAAEPVAGVAEEEEPLVADGVEWAEVIYRVSRILTIHITYRA